MTAEHLPAPKKSTGDGLHAWLRLAASTVPTGSALMQMLVTPPLEKRRTEWMNNVVERLDDLEKARLVDYQELSESPEFLSVFIRASTLAMQNHQDTKLEALRNAILNVACKQTPEDAELHLYLQLVDALSELQIKILKVFLKPNDVSTQALMNITLEKEISSFKGKNDIYPLLYSDLVAKNLINGTATTARSVGASMVRTTGLGTSFCKFISDPQTGK